jgi:hypothetical protein
MKKLMERAFLISTMWVLCTSLEAQQWLWNAGFNGFFDNREYFNDYVKPQTMFGSRAFGYTGFAFDNQNEFGVGIDALYEFGDRIRKQHVNPILFYHFSSNSVNLILGAYPRRGLIELPDFLLSDTLNYYRPNFEGIFVEFSRPWGFQRAWLDWTSRQDDFTRETFKIGGTGMIHKGVFFYRHDFVMTHYAGPAIPIPDDHIRDNGGLYCGLGLDFSHPTTFDTLVVSSGLCLSYDRVRNVFDTRLYYGSMTQITAEYKGFGIKTTTYIGQGQKQIGGDGLYSAPLYNRFDFYWRIFRKRSIQGKVEFTLHLVENVLDTSQALTIYANLGGRRPLHNAPGNN